MLTNHRIFYQDSAKLENISDESIHLVVTSPPYPMIAMWDSVFSSQNQKIKKLLEESKGQEAFELMHGCLDKVWAEMYRVLVPGGIACINVGDATRTLSDNFQLYSSHSRILSHCSSLGFQILPSILWRKQTNAPNKFMGSGMLPPGAYVTLEHEYILILRKGGKRLFNTQNEKNVRRESAFFWEERNLWFSDLWTNLKGTRQELEHEEVRERSAAYPFELAYRLVNMFSVKGDTVLDPFLGLATTTLAAIASERNSIGIEIEPNFKQIISKRIENSQVFLNKYIEERLANHIKFVNTEKKKSREFKYANKHHQIPVITLQEKEIILRLIEKIKGTDLVNFEVSYSHLRSN